jgi:hypothetical protein
MPSVVTSIARVKDWQALQELSNTTLVGQARQAGVSHYRVYRNLNDASQALLIFELPSHYAFELMSSEGVNEQVNTLLDKGDDGYGS